MDNLDLTPTGQSYFDTQRTEYQRIFKNGRKLMEEQEKKGSCSHELVSREYVSQLNNDAETRQSDIQLVSCSDTISLTRDELNTFLQDWSAGYSAEEQSLSWDEKSLRIVNFLGLDE